MAERRTIVVFYNARYSLPLRSSNEAHVYAWRRYANHRVVYVNVGFGVPWALLDRLAIDAVVFDTLFLSMHWDPDLFDWRSAACVRLRERRCPKIAIVQDEFMNMDVVNRFLASVGITHILSCAEPADWPRIYSGIDRDRVRFRTALTGYVDERRLERIAGMARPARTIDLGYRAWNNPFWLGEHGTRKVEIGRILGEEARRRGFRIDINPLNARDFLIGDRWFDFLLSCRAVLGVEGGASVLDWDGTIRERVDRYLRDHPDAGFEQTRAACFPGRDHAIGLACLSPRHFEAAMTRTCQVLLEGEYNGVFEPWRHYIPVRRDYGNLDEVFDALADHCRTAEIAERCFEEVVASGNWTYRRFIRALEETMIEPGIEPGPATGDAGQGRVPRGPVHQLCRILLALREVAVMSFARFEARSAGLPRSVLDRTLLAHGRYLLDLG